MGTVSVAGLLVIGVIPLVHARAVRLTMRRLEALTPISRAEIQADKDQLRAEFAMAMSRLEMNVEQMKAKTTSQAAEIEYVRNINQAAKKEQYWRAAAWALERLNPEDFAKRSPGYLTPEEVRTLLDRVGEILLDEIPVARFRKAALKRLDRLLAKIEPVTEALRAEDSHDDES